jgi:hypothetical protein
MDFIKDYFEGFVKNTRFHFPETFSSSIAFTNVFVFGLTSIIMFFFHEPLAYLYFLLIFTSSEADGNISQNLDCVNLFRKIDIVVILLIIITVYNKTGALYGLLLIPLMIVHHWKRYDKNPEEYEIKMNVWHYFAAFVSILGITIYSIKNN